MRPALLKALHCSLLLTAFFVTGCKAQAGSGGNLDAKTSERVEAHIRSQMKVPATIAVKLGQRKPSDFTGYDTLPVTFKDPTRETTVDFLLSKDTKTLARLSKYDIQEDLIAKQKADREKTMATIDVKGRPVYGNPNAKVTIVNYDDFQCPFCQRMHGTLMSEVAKHYGDKVKIIYKDYPLTSIHPWAMRAAINANCLAAQKNDAYWEFANSVHSNLQAIQTSDKGERKPVEEQKASIDKFAKEAGAKHGVNSAQLDACMKPQDDSGVKKSMAEGDSLGVDSTPTLFINGEMAAGAYPFEALKPIIDKALQDAGVPLPAEPEKPAAPASGDAKPAASPSQK